jgi:hypothetical protein
MLFVKCYQVQLQPASLSQPIHFEARMPDFHANIPILGKSHPAFRQTAWFSSNQQPAFVNFGLIFMQTSRF